MTYKSKYLLMLLTIIVLSFPSICFSELKTVQGEYCETYMGDMKDKKELEDFRKTVRRKSIENGLGKLTTPKSMLYVLTNTLEGQFTDKCISHVISNYLEKVVFVSHTEKERNICDKVKIILDPEVINQYLSQSICKTRSIFDIRWEQDIDDVLTEKTEKINIGLIIETRIPNLEEYKRELLENEDEKQFFNMTVRNKGKYTVVDRRHLKTILEEQKLSTTGLTDSNTVKLGKILNLDIIVLRLIYENSRVTKVLKVDTGEVLLFKTYETYMAAADVTLKCEANTRCDAYLNNCVKDPYSFTVNVVPQNGSVTMGSRKIKADFSNPAEVVFIFTKYTFYINRYENSTILTTDNEVRYGWCSKVEPSW